MKTDKKSILHRSYLFVVFFVFVSCQSTSENKSVSSTMNTIITRIYEGEEEKKINEYSQNEILEFLTSEEIESLALEYWKFQLDDDADVFVCRDENQEEVPYWIEQNGFEKTDYKLKNEFVTYEVWHKRFSKGMVNLGINGFDRHRYVYFTLIKPLKGETSFNIQPVFPEKQEFFKLQEGVFTYYDWDELVITDFSNELKGAFLLPTIRGRSREAHLIHAFRETEHPSSEKIDQIIQTWSDDPATSVTIGWRTIADNKESNIKYWKVGDQDTMFLKVKSEILEDRLLANDRYISRFTTNIKNLEKGTDYQYQIETPMSKSAVHRFVTDSGGEEFKFGWFGDVHIDPLWGENIQKTDSLFSDLKFYLFSGDLVNTGLYRNEWDKLFDLSGSVFQNKPFMASPGNHDSQEGLPPTRYLEYLKYPKNGPSGIEPGLTYKFVYGNALFLMLDGVTYSIKEQKMWLEETLQQSKEVFKIAVFHFPPFTPNEDYDDIVEHWVPLFEKYNVDLVLNGHFHYYLRNKGNNAPLEEKNSPTYVMSVGTTHKNSDGPIPSNPNIHYFKNHLFQKFSIKGNKLEMIAYDFDGDIIDQYIIEKN